MRERSRPPHRSLTTLQLAVGRRGLGPGEQGEQRTQRASFAATSHTSVHIESSSSHAGLGCCVIKKIHVKRRGMSLRGQAESERRLG